MREIRIKNALTEAQEFIARCRELLQSPNKDYEITGSKLSGNVRRSSMELTRLLAEMRKP